VDNPAPGKKLFFSALLIFLSLGALELFFRLLPEPPRESGYRSIYNPELAFPKFYLKDAKLFWRLRPRQTIASGFVVPGFYQINSAGFRDREFSEKSTAGKARLLCLGTSVTFGWGVGQEEPFPQVLQKENQKWEVYNCGQTGYSTFQGKRLLNELLPKYKPQAVVIEFVWNDLLPAFGGKPDSDQKMLPASILALQNTLSHLAAYRWGRYFLLRFLTTRQEGFGVPRVSPDEFAANLKEIADSCQTHGTTPILLLPPAPKPEWLGRQENRYRSVFYLPFRQYAEKVKIFASVNRLPLIDADSALAGELSIWENLPEDFVHPSAQAHKRIAWYLTEALAGPAAALEAK
jgi:lysophospholipase L1-like esterase